MVSAKAVAVVCAGAACRAAAFASGRAGFTLAASKLASPRCCTRSAAASLRMDVAVAPAPLMPPPTFYPNAAEPAQAAAAAAPAPLMAPPALYQNAVKLGEAKAAMPVSKILTLGILSGCHIAFGAMLAISVGGTCSNMAATNPGAQKFLLGAGTAR
eukprot:16689-Heterococcus_DN1.PRE.9